MIFQFDQRLYYTFYDTGCNVLVCVWYAAIHALFEAAPEKINRMTERWIARGAVLDDLAIQDYEAVYRDLGLNVRYRNEHTDPSYQCGPAEFEHLCWKNGKMKHFTAGNGAGIVTYDPMGRSRTVATGFLESKRIFKVLL